MAELQGAFVFLYFLNTIRNEYSFKYEEIKLHKQKENKGHSVFEFPTKSTP